MLLVNGRVTGTWTHEAGPRRVRIALAAWRRLTKAERMAIEAEAVRIAAFLVPGAAVEPLVAESG